MLAAAGGVLWGLSFAREPLGVASWLTLAPLILLLAHPRAGRLAFLHGLAAWLTGLYWIVPTLITYGGLPPAAAAALTTLLAAFLALFHGAFGWLGGPLWRAAAGRLAKGEKYALAVRLFGLPALWVALEWLRTYFLGGFPWNLAAYAWIGVAGALPLAAWIGAYGVSFLVVWVAVGLAATVERLSRTSRGAGRRSRHWRHSRQAANGSGSKAREGRTPEAYAKYVEGVRPSATPETGPFPAPRPRRWWVPLGAGLAVPLLLLPLAGRWSGRLAARENARVGQAGLPVRILQPNIANLVGWDPAAVMRNYRKVVDLSYSYCQPGVLVIWPESAAWPFVYGRDAVLDQDLRAMSDRGCTVLLNSSSPAGDSFYNSAFLLAPASPPERYDKRHLVPFGEYVPFKDVFFFLKKLARNAGDFRPADRLVLLPWRGEKLGAAICYEVVFPEEVALLTRAGATLLATITNDAWYGDTAAPWQHLRAARFRAAENRRTMLRAAITGVSALIAPDGSVPAKLGVGEEGVIRAQVAGETLLTPYARRPWLPPLACTAAAAAFVVYCSWRRS
ncbi:MAG TPA: apolipoprotein N-acyltransferase [Thermoanaerobaculia bacterium]|nr:apolipoprotein N-acyltransferase [Thermoanaerobaculia bacterium]